jgi:hypothetical protein
MYHPSLLESELGFEGLAWGTPTQCYSLLNKYLTSSSYVTNRPGQIVFFLKGDPTQKSLEIDFTDPSVTAPIGELNYMSATIPISLAHCHTTCVVTLTPAHDENFSALLGILYLGHILKHSTSPSSSLEVLSSFLAEIAAAVHVDYLVVKFEGGYDSSSLSADHLVPSMVGYYSCKFLARLLGDTYQNDFTDMVVNVRSDYLEIWPQPLHRFLEGFAPPHKATLTFRNLSKKDERMHLTRRCS